MSAVAVPAFVSRGDGETALVLLHGVGGGKSFWAPQLDALARAHARIVAWDMPGYGDSATLAPYTFDALARSLGRLLDRIAARRVVLVGHSMGGMVALEAMALFPERIAGLVLSATSPAFGKPDGEWQQAFLRQRLEPLDQGKSMAHIAPALVRGMVAPQADSAAVQRAVEVMSAVPAETYRAALHALVSFDRRALLPSIAVPTLALAGEADGVAPPAVLEKMAGKIPGARYHCIARAGHLLSLEQPGAFTEAVLRFVRTAL
ncbi:MAG TPA: alpha/beta fold hydrolase [Burkholderiales bacterium]|nr:alpha/beta fold hydrolase [Burkholderiales bacterium]